MFREILCYFVVQKKLMKTLISSVKDFEVTKMKLISIISFLILPFFVFQFTGCSSVQPTVSNNLLSVSTPSPTPLEFPKDNNSYSVNEDFKEKWRNEYNATLAEIEQNRRLWQKNRIVNYSFVCQQFAGGMNGWGEVVIKVRESENVLIERTEKDSPAKIDGYENFDTIDRIFNYLNQELDKGRLVKVKYNKELGYPEELSINYSFNIDAFYGVFVRKFEIIK